MNKVNNVELLGTEYTVADSSGTIIKTIQVIPHVDILEAALGVYSEDKYASMQEYLEKSIAALTGFDKVDPSKVMWFGYKTEDDEIDLTDLIEYAIKNGYDKIILEHLDILGK